MPSISITSSLYKTEKFLPDWQNSLYKFAKEAKKIGLDFEINAIANEPSPAELQILKGLEKETWFNLYTVPREPFYASWNRGVDVANSNVCTSWNVDDVRNPQAMIDGLNKIKNGAEMVYFPFIYKRYLTFFGRDFLVKRKLINPPFFERERFTKEMHGGPFYMFTKTLHKKIGPYDESFRIAGDYDWCVRAAKASDLVKSDVVAGIFSKRDGTLSGGKNPLQEQENSRIENKFNK